MTEAKKALNAVAKIGKGKREKMAKAILEFKRSSGFRLRIHESRFYNYAFNYAFIERL